MGVKIAPRPAPAASMRHARLPCGTSSSSISPARYSASNTYESDWRGKEQMIFFTRRAFSSAASPVSRVTGVVVDDGQVARAARDQRVDQLRRHARGAEAADHDGGAVVDVGDGRFERANDLVDHGFLHGAARAGRSPAAHAALAGPTVASMLHPACAIFPRRIAAAVSAARPPARAASPSRSGPAARSGRAGPSRRSRRSGRARRSRSTGSASATPCRSRPARRRPSSPR